MGSAASCESTRASTQDQQTALKTEIDTKFSKCCDDQNVDLSPLIAHLELDSPGDDGDSDYMTLLPSLESVKEHQELLKTSLCTVRERFPEGKQYPWASREVMLLILQTIKDSFVAVSKVGDDASGARRHHGGRWLTESRFARPLRPARFTRRCDRCPS